jgi:hypothetical protein
MLWNIALREDSHGCRKAMELHCVAPRDGLDQLGSSSFTTQRRHQKILVKNGKLSEFRFKK